MYIVAGLRRTGIHAIALWAFRQFKGDSVLYNDVPIGTCPRTIPRTNIFTGTGKFPGRGPHPCVMVLHEDRGVAAAAGSKPGITLGPASHVHRVMILRDPWNMLASRITWGRKPKAHAPLCDPKHGRLLWVEYAREFLTHRYCPSAVCVNYNRWVSDENYRASIGEKLSLPDPHKAPTEVSWFGGGSSYTACNVPAAEMPVLSRWRGMIHDKQFRSFALHPLLFNLGARIFGEKFCNEIRKAMQ